MSQNILHFGSAIEQQLAQNAIQVGSSSGLAVSVLSSSIGDILVDSSTGLTIKSGVIVNSQISSAAAIAYSKLSLSSSIVDGDISGSAAIALSKLAPLTASRALVSDGSGIISVSSVTSTELGYVSGVTSSIQTQISSKISSTEKGAANGVASLDSGGKIPLGQLPASLMEYQGTWDASTNSPTLADGTGVSGYFYRVNVAGTQNLGSGSQTFVVGDWVMYDGAIWELAHAGADAVISVNGAAGAVTVNAINQLTGDVTTSAASGSQSKAATIAAGAVTASKLGTITDGITLDQSGLGSTLEVKTGGISNAQISSSAAIAYSKLSLAASIKASDINSQSATSGQVLTADGSGGASFQSVTSGTVTSVAVSVPSFLSVSGSPITSSGTIAISLATEAANSVFAGPTSGGSATPTFRSLVSADIPDLSASYESVSNFASRSYLGSIAMAASQVSAASLSGLSFAFATYGSMKVDYCIIESSTNARRQGTMYISTDGSSNVGFADQYAESSIIGNPIQLSAIISGSVIQVQYAGTGSNTCTMRAEVTKFLA